MELRALFRNPTIKHVALTSFLFEDYPAPYAEDMEQDLINTVIKVAISETEIVKI